MNIKHNPLNETIIHEISVFRSALEMAKTYTAGMSHFHEQFKWTSGVVMIYSGIDSSKSDIFSKEFLKGKIHWEWVSVAPMPKYYDGIKVSANLSIPVKDVSYNSRFVEIGRFLSNRIQVDLKENEAYPFLVSKSREMEK